GVCTGRVLRGETHVTGAAVDAAVALSRGEGVRLDATTASIARGYTLARQADGSALLDARAQRSDTSVTDPGYQTPFLAREAELDRARASLETVLRGLAARGGLVVLAVDDVQWLDPPSQSAIQWVCENAVDLPLAVWFFGRPEARGSAAAVLPGASVIELKPL